jgi:hypothetical protein
MPKQRIPQAFFRIPPTAKPSGYTGPREIKTGEIEAYERRRNARYWGKVVLVISAAALIILLFSHFHHAFPGMDLGN